MRRVSIEETFTREHEINVARTFLPSHGGAAEFTSRHEGWKFVWRVIRLQGLEAADLILARLEGSLREAVGIYDAELG